MSAAPILNISRDGQAIRSVSIEGEAELGRSEGCLIRLDDRAISRKHALFTATPGGVQIERKSDFAPLSVNGVECTRALLKDGDVIEIGPYLLRLAAQSSGPPLSGGLSGNSPGNFLTDFPPSSLPEPDLSPPPPPSSPTFSDSPNVQPAEHLETAIAETILDEVSFEPLEELGSQDAPLALKLDPPSDSGTNIEIGGDAQDSSPGEVIQSPEQMLDQLPDLNFNPHSELPEVADHSAGQSPALISHDLPDFEPSRVDEDARTKLLPTGKLSASLELAKGLANVTHFVLEDEASIGRGKACDIILRDKKASRKHAIIRRQGSSFVIRDLESANGTFVNGVQVTELQLSGDDVIRIGKAEFAFKALSQDYIEQQEAFLPISSQEEEPSGQPDDMDAPFPPAEPMQDIAGISNGRKKEKQSLVEKFRALPKGRQMVVGACLLALFYFVFIDDDTPSPPKSTQKIVEKGPKTATFDTLTEEQKKFVISEHDLAFDYYKNREYDKTLFELNKIFALISDYKDSRELERYSNEGKHKLEVLEEERRKKAEEERLRLRIADLVDQTKVYMDKKQYDKAHDFFPQILALDPDNAMVAEWSKLVDRYEEQKAMEEQVRAVQAQIDKRAWDIYNEGMGLKKQLKYQEAIETLRKVSDIGATDKKLAAATAAGIEACISELAALRDPVLAEAKQSEDAQDLPKAYQLYEKATQIDPNYPAGFAGMDRIRGILHDRAKGLYIEAVLAESYSDFTSSKKKFQECMQVAPKDDIYHERAERKLASYFLKSGDAAPQ